MVAVKKNRKQRRYEEKLLKQEKKKLLKEKKGQLQEIFDSSLKRHQTMNPKEIIDFYQTKLNDPKISPDELDIYGMTAIEFNFLDQGIELLKKSISKEPDNVEALYYLGATYFKIKHYSHAIEFLQKALVTNGAHYESTLLLADAFIEVGDFKSSIRNADRALQLNPESAEALTIIGEGFLLNHEYEKALSAFKQSYVLRPYNTRNLSLLYIACSQTKDDLNLSQIYPLDKLVKTYVPETPKGFNSSEEFRKVVVNFINQHPHLEKNPKGFSTKNGYQTMGDLLKSTSHPVFDIIEHHIHKAVKNHVTDLPLPPQHPFILGCPEEYRIASWAVKLEKQGHQDAHVHLDGWLSGVYYLSIPKEVAEAVNNEGSLEFGVWRSEYELEEFFNNYSIKPKEGKIVTFPSFLWHRTIPFESEEYRICIAFDIVPE